MPVLPGIGSQTDFLLGTTLANIVCSSALCKKRIVSGLSVIDEAFILREMEKNSPEYFCKKPLSFYKHF